MGAKGPLVVVNASEWIRRTALTFSSRSASTSRVDAAYAAWCTARFDPLKAATLRDALDDYLAEKGGDWSKVSRNSESGGLMQYIYEEAKAIAPARSSAVAARRRIRSFDIPHSRYGVLYLLGNIEIDMNCFNIVMEGVAAVGGAIGSGFAANMSHLNTVNQASRHVDIGGRQVSAQAIVSASSTAIKVLPKAGKKIDETFGISQPLGRERRWSPTGTVRPVMDNADSGPVKSRVNWNYPVTKAGFEMLKDDPALFLNPWMLPATAAGAVIVTMTETLNNLRREIESAVSWAFEKIKNGLLGASASTFTLSGGIVRSLIKIVVTQCLASAAPFVGAAMDLGAGIVKTLRAAAEKVGAWLERRRIQLNEGHPELIAAALEGEMQKGMFQGLWTTLKGAVSMALSSFLPGAGSLVSAIVTGVEWLVKFAFRLWEQSKIHAFLVKAREFYLEERELATRDPGPRGLEFQPNMAPDRGGIIHDVDRFSAFFQEGCNASPLIPMLTLNTGICGSLMTMVNLFRDENDDARAVVDRATYNSGVAYFSRLKAYGAQYLQNSGFKFRPSPTETRGAIQGLLDHAVHHHGQDTMTGKAVAFLAAT
jgi:predicted SprT family Zn-dependent metalloprotease